MMTKAWIVNSDGIAVRRATVEEFTRGMRNNKKVSINGEIYYLLLNFPSSNLREGNHINI